MSRYQVDGKVYDTERAVQSWNEATDWNGNNHISRATGSQWNHETLYRSSKGTYYVEYVSQQQGTLPHARAIGPIEAVGWLLLNGHDLPDDLKEFEKKVIE